MPRVSILLPAYNRAEVMRYAIRSVLQQDFTDWELVVAGDACTDHSEEVALSFGDPRISFFNRDRNSGGQSAPINDAFQRSDGEFIFILNQDDMYFGNHLSSCLSHMRATGADLIWSPVVLLRRSGRAEGAADPRYDLLDIGGAVSGGGYDPEVFVIGSSMAMTRAAMGRAGPWPEASDTLLLPSQAWLFNAVRAGVKTSYREALSVLCILAGDRRFAYLKSVSAEHARAWSWVAGRPHAGDDVLGCLALNLAAERYRKGWHLQPPTEDAAPKSSALADYADRLGIHPHELRDAVLGKPRGDLIARHRRHTADATPLEIGQTLEFGRNLVNPYLDDNWHSAEADGRWTASQNADILFRPRAEPGTLLALRIRALPLQRDDETEIAIDGRVVARHRFGDVRVCDVALGPAEGKPLRLTLTQSRITSPKALGTADDPRPLGLKVIEADLRRADPLVQPPPALSQ